MLLRTPSAGLCSIPAWGLGKVGALSEAPTPVFSCLLPPLDVSRIKTQLQQISAMLQKMQNQSKLGPGEVEPWM